jgi:c-di-GMP-binding flagellar brake protein YcgR
MALDFGRETWSPFDSVTRRRQWDVGWREGESTMDDPQLSTPERRRYPRVKTPVQVELRPEGSAAPLRVETSDISATGCYVEMSMTLAVGSRLAIVLWVGDERVTAEGIVRTQHPQFGNGIEFAGMSTGDRDKLVRHLESISNNNKK